MLSQKAEQVGQIVQIGLHRSAEYCVLIWDWWKHNRETDPVIQKVPDIILDMYEKWNYHGIDNSIHSIDFMRKRHYDYRYDNLQWICCGVGVNPGFMFSGYDQIVSKQIPHYTICLTLEQLFESLKLSEVDILAVDIEGGEHEIFQTYKWKIKPKFIDVEIHLFNEENKDLGIIETIKDQGYTVYGEIEHSADEKYTIHYPKFIRNDLL